MGVVLLGFTLSVQSIARSVRPRSHWWWSRCSAPWCSDLARDRVGLGRPRSLLIATGFAICGASAIAAMQRRRWRRGRRRHRRRDGDDLRNGGDDAVPLLQAPFGLTDIQLGIWAGASVQEVGQVVAAAGPAGASVVAVAVVVKLIRVMLLAPVVAAVSVYRRVTDATCVRRPSPPIVPLFVLGFLGCAALRSFGLVPAEVLSVISHLQVGALGIALFGMGAAVRLATLFRRSGPVLVVATVSTVFIAGVSLGGIHLLGLG